MALAWRSPSGPGPGPLREIRVPDPSRHSFLLLVWTSGRFGTCRACATYFVARRCAVTPHEGRATSHRQASALGDPRPQGLLSVPQRFPEPHGPTVSAAQPSQPRLGAPPVGRRAGRPVQRAPSRGRGGSPCPQPSNPETPRGLSVLEGWATSTFSRAERPYRHCSAAPHFAPGACLGSRAGCPASTTPLTRAGQPPELRMRQSQLSPAGGCGRTAPRTSSPATSRSRTLRVCDIVRKAANASSGVQCCCPMMIPMAWSIT